MGFVVFKSFSEKNAATSHVHALGVCSTVANSSGAHDKYEQRVHVPSITSLRIDNLTRKDSVQYRARGSFTGGRVFNLNFHLTVYDPGHFLIHHTRLVQHDPGVQGPEGHGGPEGVLES
ncbi:hypothetical protein MC885_019673 [Smutsia gigantea]|nr:hypothetical protein MC885_019673 [Smutsia gigantea]